MKTQIQTRGICSICGSEQAVDSKGLIAYHGYTTEYGFFSNSCFGSREWHYGHDSARKVIDRYLDKLNATLSSLPQRISILSNNLSSETVVRNKIDIKSNISALEHQVRILPKYINSMIERRNAQQTLSLLVIDIEIQTREESLARKSAADNKAAEKAKQSIEKELIDNSRQQKAKEKLELLLSKQWRQITFDGVVALEWEEAFNNESDLLETLRTATEKFLLTKVESGEITNEELYCGNHGAVAISRTGSGKSGKLLEKITGFRWIKYG